MGRGRRPLRGARRVAARVGRRTADAASFGDRVSYLFVLGGARSGKSAYALGRARAMGGDAVTFVATARSADADPELARRIAEHRRERPGVWSTLEAGVDLAAAVRAASPGDVLLVDSLTLWASTLLEREADPVARWDEARRAIDARAQPCVIVSDELG
ncbi:MAG: hypothetical protein FJ034_08490, partial [Chloroflexi bacterium]|nr:hypothetical protein [Chloroflexota bacterium]